MLKKRLAIFISNNIGLVIAGLVASAALNTKTDVDNEISDIVNLARKAALNAKATRVNERIRKETYS